MSTALMAMGGVVVVGMLLRMPIGFSMLLSGVAYLWVKDQPGVLAKITGTLGEHGISIASVIQHDVPGSSDEGVPLVIMTHACASSAVQKAVAAIDTSDVVRAKSVCLSVLEE